MNLKKWTLLSLLSISCLCSSSFGQTAPNWPFKYNPPPEEWAATWSGKVDVLNGTLTNPTISNQAINVLNFPTGLTPVDITGATDASPAIRAAITKACASIPAKAVYIPSGKYDILTRITIPGNCDGLTIHGDPGATLILDAASVANTAILANPNTTAINRLTIENITFDGNAANSTNRNTVVGWSWPTDKITFINDTFQNTNGTALSINGQQPLTGNISVAAAAGQPVLTFTAIPVGVVPGSYVVTTACVDADMYVVSTTATTVTLNRNLPDSCLIASATQFTRGFTSNADTVFQSTTIAIADTSKLTVGQTISTQSVCLQYNTRISTIVANTSITINKPVQCLIVSGTNFAAAGGSSDFRIINSTFSEIGQSNLYGGTRSYTANGSSVAGPTLTLNCITGNCSQGGIIPGQKTGVSPPAGVPANTLITDVSYNTGLGTFTVTLASPLTGTITNGTSIPFQVSIGGLGYGVWLSWGGPFANTQAKFIGNRFLHIWSAPVFAMMTQDALFQGNTYTEDQMEYRDPITAPSPCINLQSTIGATVNGDKCSGATGSGLEAQHPVNLRITNFDSSNNGGPGVNILGGHDIVLNSITANNNGCFRCIPYTQDFTNNYGAASGVQIGGSASFSSAGTVQNVTVSNVSASDTQSVPTQSYAVRKSFNTSGTLTNFTISNVVGSGNITTTIDPLLLAANNDNVAGAVVATLPTSAPIAHCSLWSNAGVVTISTCP